jgi:hypothetical protein
MYCLTGSESGHVVGSRQQIVIYWSFVTIPSSYSVISGKLRGMGVAIHGQYPQAVCGHLKMLKVTLLIAVLNLW